MAKAGSKYPCGRPMSEGTVSSHQAELEKLKLRLENYIQTKKLKRSESREKILEIILDAMVQDARHFRPQDLLDRLRARYPKLGRATLYRSIPLLIESGVIQEGPAHLDGQVTYELSETAHHDHIVCLDCHRIFEFHDEAIEKRQEQHLKKMGFRSVNHRHVVYSRCQFLEKP